MQFKKSRSPPYLPHYGGTTIGGRVYSDKYILSYIWFLNLYRKCIHFYKEYITGFHFNKERNRKLI